ncbi:recombinase family protein [Ancylobacter sp. Lp-2]|uniref:recombinase family protein n=1 Tax=Ancylobacter sp. Lp-2 TaxID=2881339 RepID=UPI001E56A375|nr:recombinase family protein [Ancylobacter sp. Lp-2]MCB4771044.1 recombinase family protein [Ancylobacter sp. Lp-2]
MTEGTFVAYFRVSTDRQGRSGLGLEAQQKAVSDYLNGGAWKLAGQFIETESGKDNDRPELAKALALCRKRKAKQVIAKLDRLSRNLSFIAALMDSGVEFVATDNPHANRLTIHILAAVAQHEREQIAERTRVALAAARARGTKLGRHGAEVLAVRHKAEATERAQHLVPVFAELADLSTRAAAAELNRRGIPTPTGGQWHPIQVQRTRKRLAA